MTHRGRILGAGLSRSAALQFRRITTGLVFADDFTRANGAPGSDWAVNYGLGNTVWRVQNNALECVMANGAGDDTALRCLAIAPRMDYHAQVSSLGAGWQQSGLMVRRSGASTIAGRTGYHSDQGYGSGLASRVYRAVNNVYTLLMTNGNFPATVMYRNTFSAIGANLAKWVDGVQQGAPVVDVAPINTPGGLELNAFHNGATTFRFDDLTVCSARAIRIKRVPVGWFVRTGGITSAASTGADVLLDPLGALFPFPKIEVLTPALVVFSQLVAPVYPGDVYTL